MISISKKHKKVKNKIKRRVLHLFVFFFAVINGNALHKIKSKRWEDDKKGYGTFA